MLGSYLLFSLKGNKKKWFLLIFAKYFTSKGKRIINYIIKIWNAIFMYVLMLIDLDFNIHPKIKSILWTLTLWPKELLILAL